MTMLQSASVIEGKRVANVVLRIRAHEQWKNVTTDSLLKHRTVVAFSLPGAYTPTCSSNHLPRYRELAGQFRANGVDEIVCVSVDAAFVMNESRQHGQNSDVTLCFDRHGGFTASLRFMVDKHSLDFGERSWRYSMLIKDGLIEKMFVEPDKEGFSLEVSDADTMLRHINPAVVAPEPAVIFVNPGCPQCARAKALLESRGYQYDEFKLGRQVTARTLRAVTGSGTWPQIFIGGKLIGNASALEAYFDEREAA
jgi:glutaredoxin-like protein